METKNTTSTKKLVESIMNKDYMQSNETLKSILGEKAVKAIDDARINVAKSFFSEGSAVINESDFSVGDDVECIESGMTGTVVKVNPDGVGKYYTVKREDGKTMKYAPDELKMNE